jgi:hypothetical protein
LPADELKIKGKSTLAVMNNTMRLLGEIIRETCNLKQEVINQALALQRRNGFRLGEILIQQNIISEPDLNRALSIQAAWPGIDNEDPDETLVHVQTWFKLVFFAILMGSAAMVGIWFFSGLLLTLFINRGP